ncbi:MAG: CRISPR-associated protein Csx3 [Oscillochloridaceae bacterium umkhey_bin13]
MAPLFPAVLIGGPAHAGKSTLTYRLSQQLRALDVPHYALRASPDGEGDWSNRIPDALVAELRPRARAGWTHEFATAITRDVAQRHLPLIVDAGGLVSPETALIAARCTHAILLAANPDDLAPWRELVSRNGIALIADLHSVLDAPQSVTSHGPPLRGQMSGLNRTASSDGPCFAALIDALCQLFAYTPDELFQAHVNQTAIELVLNLEQTIYPVMAHDNQPWQPHELAILLPTLPTDVPLAIYGRGPNWLYAALATVAPTCDYAVFDPRQGWVTIPRLGFGTPNDDDPLQCELVDQTTYMHLKLSLRQSYLDRRDTDLIRLPPVTQGLILDGRMPMWLWAALTRAYLNLPWLACYQPPLGAAVVVHSHEPAYPRGTLIPISVAT